jgi:rhomboid protease GluP
MSVAPQFPNRLRDVPLVIWVILIACRLPELVLEGASAGYWGSPRWRGLAYSWAGFWPGLLHNWQPNYPGQGWVMFLSYGFVHEGFAHLLGNMLVLVWLGLPVVSRVGTSRFVLIYILSMIGGGLGYALLSTGLTPMVGASGALFGLAGAWVAWEYVDRFTAGEMLWPVLRIVAVLAGLNLLSWWATSGNLAWQTHLGGFIAGWITALLADPRPRTA